MAVAGLVCAIVGIFIADFVLGPLGIIFGAIGLSRANHGGTGRGMALAGIVIGIIDVVLFIVLIIVAAHSHGSRFSWHI